MALKGRRFDTRESIIADSKKVTPNFDVQHIHKHSSDKDIKLNAFSKKVGTPKNQMNHCLIDLDSPNIFSNINNIPTSHPSKSLLDEDNIEEVPHVPLLEALGPKPITLLPTNVTNLQANPRTYLLQQSPKDFWACNLLYKGAMVAGKIGGLCLQPGVQTVALTHYMELPGQRYSHQTSMELPILCPFQLDRRLQLRASTDPVDRPQQGSHFREMEKLRLYSLLHESANESRTSEVPRLTQGTARRQEGGTTVCTPCFSWRARQGRSQWRTHKAKTQEFQDTCASHQPTKGRWPTYSFTGDQPVAPRRKDKHAESLSTPLSSRAGDRIIFLHEINKDWWYGEINGKRGQFPSKFVADDSSESFINDNIEASPSPLQALVSFIAQIRIISTLIKENHIYVIKKEDLYCKLCGGQITDEIYHFTAECGDLEDQKRVVALYDFLEGEKGDLAFKTGDVIMVLYQINSDWIFGELNGKQGQFPANFVQDEAPENNASNENPEKVMNECMPPPLGIFVALYNFKAEQPGDLELHEGDRVLVTECIDNEWWQGMITPAGTTGIFPSNFVKRID
ncbi:SH3D19 [Cordylochernes scorpioides]|uniref:SH3D19 n=1 Tax=Cordylochernes scorpioides TaxID=51811 RepID=A0ABY6LV53_9ARAC|nr:SH3D19 [Cordylochernes scorpioides]